MNELEQIGRFHQLQGLMQAKLSQRNAVLLQLRGAVAYALEKPTNRHKAGRAYNVDGVALLTERAAGFEEELQAVLTEMKQYAAVANQEAPELE